MEDHVHPPTIFRPNHLPLLLAMRRTNSGRKARQRWQARESVSIISRKIKMSKFQLEDDRFAIRADLRVVLETHGAGVYQINLFGVLDGEVELISEYVLFYGIPRPTGYSPS